MKMTGEYTIAAPREQVWQALNDPEVLKDAIPGCRSLTRLSDTEYEAEVTTRVGPVQATFKGRITLSDLDPPNGYRISGQGSGGAAGFARGGATVTLTEPAPSTTTLAYDVDAQVGGKLAQIGQRLIDATARKTADEFFARFRSRVEGPAEAAPETAAEPAAEPLGREAMREVEREHERSRRLIWLGLAILAAIVIWILIGN